MRASATGSLDHFNALFNLRVDGSDTARLVTKYGALHQPSGQAVVLDGSLAFDRGERGGSIKVSNCQLVVGPSILQGNGNYHWSGAEHDEPSFDLILSTPSPVPASTMVAVLNPTIKQESVGGTVKGTLAFAGTPSRVLSHGDVTMHELTVPELKLEAVNGRIESPSWALFRPEGLRSLQRKSEARLSLESGRFGGISARRVQANIKLEEGKTPRLAIRNGSALVSGGTVELNGWYEPNSTKVHAEFVMKDLLVDQLFTNLLEQTGEISGLADATISLTSRGQSPAELTKNLSGKGEFILRSGRVSQFAKLQERLTQANFLYQGIFGFNVNNLLQSVLPVNTGRFNRIDGNFDIADGVLNLERMHFDGNDMRLRAGGSWHIPLNTISIEVAGNIPRVTSSILPGAVGTVSRNLTMQKAVQVLTFRKLESLPSIPLLGDIATDNPRAFTFKVVAPASSHEAIAQSIQKSFKWLPNKPNASAYPIPGL